MTDQFKNSLDAQFRLALASANKGNPFISKADAMRAINEHRAIVRKMGAAQ